jgi:hypothetical protein
MRSLMKVNLLKETIHCFEPTLFSGRHLSVAGVLEGETPDHEFELFGVALSHGSKVRKRTGETVAEYSPHWPGLRELLAGEHYSAELRRHDEVIATIHKRRCVFVVSPVASDSETIVVNNMSLSEGGFRNGVFGIGKCWGRLNDWKVEVSYQTEDHFLDQIAILAFVFQCWKVN